MPGHDSKNDCPITISKALPRDSIDVTGIDWQLEESTNPAQLPELTRMDAPHASSTASLLSGGVLSPGRKTMKEYEQQQKNLEQENFQLKLRVYMLEERLQANGTADSNGNMIVDLKVQVATLHEELSQKQELLRRASDTLESLEQQYGGELERQQRRADAERLGLQQRVDSLQRALESASLERTVLAERSAADQPYLRAFEPLAVDHAACHSQDELSQLEARMEELQAALGQMKQTVEERDEEGELLRRQLDEARAAAARLTEQHERCEQLSDELRQLRAARQRSAADTERQLQQLQGERDGAAAELRQLIHRLQQAEREPAAELRRTCDQLTAGRAADGARLADLEQALQSATDRLTAAAASEATLAAALQSVGAQLAERSAALSAAKKAQRRSAAHVAELIDERRQLNLNMKQYMAGGGSGTDAAPDAAPAAAPAPTVGDESACDLARSALCGAGAAPAPPLTPHEVQVYLLRTETQRKDRKIRSMVAEMKQMNELLVKYRWEVKELAEEENERLWTELEENKKLIRELQDEKMELVLEKERQIQRLLAQLKERGAVAASGGPAAVLHSGLLQHGESGGALQQTHSQVLALRSQLAHATLLVGERDSDIGRLRERLLQQRRLLDEPLSAPQLRQRLGEQLGELCAELAAPRPGAPVAAELGGAGEMASDASQSAAARSDASQLGSEKVTGLRAQLSDLRDQLLARDCQLAERDRRAEDAERLQRTLAERERELAAAGRQLAAQASGADQLLATEQRLAAAHVQLQETATLRQTLASRERELTLAEGQLNEIAELREQLEAGGEQRRELLQTRQLLTERDQEKAALLRHLDHQRGEHEREARQLRERFELAAAAPTWQQYREAESRHGGEQARLRRRLADTQGAAELLQRRLEQLADFLELLLGLEEQGVLDLSCLTAQHMSELQRSLLESRQLSLSLTQSLLLGADNALDGSAWSLDASAAVAAAEQSSLHIPELEPARHRAATVPTPAPRESSKVEPSLPGAADRTELGAIGAPDFRQAKSEQSPSDRKARPRCLQASPADPSRQPASADAATMTDGQRTQPPQPPAMAEAEVQAGSAPRTAEQATQAASTVQTTERTAQTAAEHTKQTAESTAQTCRPTTGTAERAAQTGEGAVRPAGQAELADRDAQLLQQTQLVAELRRQLERQLQPAAELGGGGDERAATRTALPGDVRDRFRSLVQRQRTTERASSTDTAGGAATGTAVERALSPILSLARAQSAELIGLGAGPQPAAAAPSRSSGQLMPPPPPPPPLSASAAVPEPAADAITAASESRLSQSARHKSHEPPTPAAADWSESEAWSEPDRDVSLARIGLDHSSLGTRTETWLAPQSESDARRASRRRQRAPAGSQQAQDLESHIDSLHQVKDALRAEVQIYQKVLPSSGQRQKQGDAQHETAGVLVPREVLVEIHSLQQQLERAIVANERIRRQLECELSPQPAAAAQLARQLQETELRLADSAEQLSDSQARCGELRAKLSRAKDSLRLAQLNAEQFKDKFVRVSDDMVRLRERFSQMETDRERTSEESGRRRHRSPTDDAVRRLERQLETAHAALRCQQQLSEQLSEQLQRPEAEPAASCSDTQLLVINREKLRLLGERAQLASRGRLLRSESCLLDGEARQVDAQRRLEAAKWAGWALERQKLTERLAAAEAAAAGRLQAETERARLAEENGQCQRRLAELGRLMQTDKRRLQQVSTQLEEVNAEMDTMRRKLRELDDAGEMESARVGDLPPLHQPEPEPEPVMRRSTSESDGHDVHHESDRTSAYSSPDLGIESDWCRGSLRAGRQLPHATETAAHCRDAAAAAEPPSAASETERLRQERDMMHSKLASTRAALQQALDKLSRADQRKARVERAIYRQLSKTHDILRRAKSNLSPPDSGGLAGGAQ